MARRAEPRARDRDATWRARRLPTRRRCSPAPSSTGARTASRARRWPSCTELVPNEGDAWQLEPWATSGGASSGPCERHRRGARPGDRPGARACAAARGRRARADARRRSCASAELLGRGSAELHRALADAPWRRRLRRRAVRRRCTSASLLPVAAQPGASARSSCSRRGCRHSTRATETLAGEVLGATARRSWPIEADATKRDRRRRIRIHGDFHLGQVLWTGPRLRDHRLRGRAGCEPISERRFKRSPLRDVAGMLRSLRLRDPRRRADERGPRRAPRSRRAVDAASLRGLVRRGGGRASCGGYLDRDGARLRAPTTDEDRRPCSRPTCSRRRSYEIALRAAQPARLGRDVPLARLARAARAGS